VGSVGSTDNIQAIFELLCSVEHIGWNSRDRIPDTGLQFIKSVNWCSEHNAHNPTGKNLVVSCLVNGVFQNPEWTLWTHCILGFNISTTDRRRSVLKTAEFYTYNRVLPENITFSRKECLAFCGI
jgi:hypothetical protein